MMHPVVPLNSVHFLMFGLKWWKTENIAFVLKSSPVHFCRSSVDVDYENFSVQQLIEVRQKQQLTACLSVKVEGLFPPKGITFQRGKVPALPHLCRSRTSCVMKETGSRWCDSSAERLRMSLAVHGGMSPKQLRGPSGPASQLLAGGSRWLLSRAI